MESHNFLTYSVQIISQILGEILYFPVWWYSAGLLRLSRALWRLLKAWSASLGFWVWLKNIFVPMYGQRDFASRIISFVMRFFQIIIRGLALLFLSLILLVVLVFWLTLPILLILALAYQLSH